MQHIQSFVLHILFSLSLIILYHTSGTILDVLERQTTQHCEPFYHKVLIATSFPCFSRSMSEEMLV